MDLPRTDKGALLGSRRSHPITRSSARAAKNADKNDARGLRGIVARLTASAATRCLHSDTLVPESAATSTKNM